MIRRLRSPYGGVAGPALFAAAWALGGAIGPGYSPVHEAISQLAAVGASVRLLMTTGLAGFGFGMLLDAGALRWAVPGPAWKAALGAGVAVFGVIAVPLGSVPMTDEVHGGFAIAAYAALVAMPLLAARRWLPMDAVGLRDCPSPRAWRRGYAWRGRCSARRRACCSESVSTLSTHGLPGAQHASCARPGALVKPAAIPPMLGATQRLRP